MIRIGVVNIDVSHPRAFSEYLKEGNRARYVAVYNDGFRGDDEVEGFMKKYKLEKRCQSIEELAEIVDVGFVQGCNWDKHLEHALPFIQKGKPVFIDKPIVGSVADCKKLEELVEKGAIILGSSSVRYAEEIQNFIALPVEERGEILSVYGTAGVDEFNYAIHIVEAIHELAGSEPVSTNFAGRAEREGLVSETFTVRFANGITGTYTTCHGQWHQFEVVIMTTKSTYYFQVDTSKIYGALLDRICDYMETGENKLAPVAKINQAIKIMLAGRLSREKGGGVVKIEGIPEDDPGFDGDEFELGYAKAAAKIYL